MVELIANVNNAINGFVWGVPMLVLLVGTGILMTILTKFFQLSHIGHWFKNTVGGNIVGVASALVAGGPGAFF